MITSIKLKNFRNFAYFSYNFCQSLILICGNNGTGKTSILEALTLIGRSENLLEQKMTELLKKNNDQSLTNQKLHKFHHYNFNEFLISTSLKHQYYQDITLVFNAQENKKTFVVNQQEIPKNKIAEYRKNFINFIFLTPQLEQLFITGKNERRLYMDKIVSDIDLEHHARINNYHKLLKERNIILFNQQQKPKPENLTWLKIIEEKIAEIAVAIAFARVEAIDFFNKAIGEFNLDFPKINLLIDGEIENKIISKITKNNLEASSKISGASLEIEYRQQLEAFRQQDTVSGRNNFGIHKSDFTAILLDKQIVASQCSTGEQKAIMMAITIARARISALYKQQPTILLFDEVISHLDFKKITTIFTEIINSNLQCFFTAINDDFLYKTSLDSNKIEIIKLD